jgi:hypothetical protein
MNFLTSKEFALELKISEVTLRQSRSTGMLLGVCAPKHLKMGRQVRYTKEALRDWIDSLEKESHSVTA